MKINRFIVLLPTILFTFFILPQEINAEQLSIKVGAFSNAPKIFQDENGSADGFWPELIAVIAKNENWKVEYVWGSWSECLDRLKSGEIDILPDVAVTNSRKKLYRFSNETVLLSWSRLYIKNSSPTYNSIFDLEGKKIAVLKGSSNYEEAGGIKEIVNSFDIDCTFIEYQNYIEAFKAVCDGLAYASVVNRNFGDKYENEYGLKNTPLVFKPANISFAFPQNTEKTSSLVSKIDNNIKLLKDETNSIYFQLLEKYFESSIAEKKYFVFPAWGKQLLTFLGLAVAISIVAAIVFRIKLNAARKKIVQNLTSYHEALVSEKSFLRSLIDSAHDAIYIKDTKGVYICCNKASEKLIGLSEKEQIGKSDFDFFDHEFAEFVQNKDRMVFEGGESVRVEESLTSAEGDFVTLDSIKAPIYRPDGQLLGLVGISRDITERKQSEAKRLELEALLRQKCKMEAVGIMAGGIAHDFNNILAIIMTNLELMHRKMGDSHALLPRLEQARAASSRAAELVKQILTYSHQGKQNKQLIQLAIIVEESLKLFRSTIPASIDLLTQIDGDVHPVMIDADSTQVEEVLFNLCHNAIYAMGEKGLLAVSLSKECLENETFCSNLKLPKGDYLKLTVTDTGTGMYPDLVEKIFDPFYTTKPVGEGTGMGLSICHSIVQKHKGYLTVDSIPDQGTAFSVYFPIVTSSQKSKEAPTQEIMKADIPSGCERILLIDDEESLVHSVSDFLVDHGYSVTAQTNSQKALTLFKANPDHFDLVITDQTMPGLTGMELTVELLKIKPELPIILCTGYSLNITEEIAKEMGIKAFFMKPFDLPVLARKTRIILDGGDV